MCFSAEQPWDLRAGPAALRPPAPAPGLGSRRAPATGKGRPRAHTPTTPARPHAPRPRAHRARAADGRLPAHPPQQGRPGRHPHRLPPSCTVSGGSSWSSLAVSTTSAYDSARRRARQPLLHLRVARVQHHQEAVVPDRPAPRVPPGDVPPRQVERDGRRRRVPVLLRHLHALGREPRQVPQPVRPLRAARRTRGAAAPGARGAAPAAAGSAPGAAASTAPRPAATSPPSRSRCPGSTRCCSRPACGPARPPRPASARRSTAAAWSAGCGSGGGAAR